MNSNIRQRAVQIVKTVTTALDHSLIKSKFDEPVDRAVRQFVHSADCPILHNQFHRLISEFAEYVYGNGLNARWKLSDEPLGDVIELLEKNYSSSYGRGYMAAALDANDVYEGGIDTVLGHLAQIIKNTERQKYINAVFAVNIDTADWHLKCEITAVLLEEYRDFLPQHLLQCKPYQLTDQIPSIIHKYICSDESLQELLTYPETSWKI